MAIYIGTTSVSSLFVGTTSISNMYVGTGSVLDSSGGGSSGSATAPTSINVEDYPLNTTGTLSFTVVNNSTLSTDCAVQLHVTGVPTTVDHWRGYLTGTVFNEDGRAANGWQYESDTVTVITSSTSTGTVYNANGSNVTGLRLFNSITLGSTTSPNIELGAANYFGLSNASLQLFVDDGVDEPFKLVWSVPSGHTNEGYLLQFKKTLEADDTVPTDGSQNWSTFATVAGDVYEFEDDDGVPHAADHAETFKYRVIAYDGNDQAASSETVGYEFGAWSHYGSTSTLSHAYCDEG